MYKSIFFIVLIFIAIYSKKTNHHIQPFQLDKGYKFLTKFHMGEGFGLVNIKYESYQPIFSKNSPHSLNFSSFFLTINVIKSEDWPNFVLSDVSACQSQFEKYTLHQEIFEIKDSANEINEKEFSLTQGKPELYYFILNDCEGKLMTNVGKYSTYILQFGLEIKNTDESHFSLENQELIFPCLTTLLIISIFFIINVNNLKKLYQKEDLVDYPMILTAIALLFELISLGLQLKNLLNYQNDGVYNVLLTFAQIFMETGANFLFSLIFIFVAWGWSINFMDILSFNYFAPTIAILGAANIILVVLNKIIFENDNQPVNEGLSYLNYIYLVYKLGFFAYFMKGVINTYGIIRTKVRVFVIKFIILGVAFFTSYGVILIFAEYLESYNQKKFILIGNEVVNSIITISLMKIFDSKIYNDLSFKAKNVLPQDNVHAPKLF